MFRLMALLCAGIYAVMLIGGQDRGQLRFGLMQAEADKAAQMHAAQLAQSQPATSVPQNDAAQVTAASFAPQAPLMIAPEPAVAVSSSPEPALDGQIFYIKSESANVREGPGKDHAVVERLPKGEAVLVLVNGEGPDGWSLIRIEGDGVEGYVASRLLAE